MDEATLTISAGGEEVQFSCKVTFLTGAEAEAWLSGERVTIPLSGDRGPYISYSDGTTVSKDDVSPDEWLRLIGGLWAGKPESQNAVQPSR